MARRIGVFGVALVTTPLIAIILAAIGLLLPVRGQGLGDPVGADCVLMAQALRSASFPYPVIGSDRQCRWRALGIPNAISYDQLPPDEDVANRTVETPRYSYGGFKAEVDVGVVLAQLAGAGKNCTYYRFWGAWHRAGCEGSWVA